MDSLRSPSTGASRATQPDSGRLLRLAGVFYGLLLAAAWLWRSVGYGEPLLYASPEAAARGIDPLRDGAVGLLAGLALVAVSRLWTNRTRSGRALADALSSLLGRLSLAQVGVLAALSGVAEEAFFRGALQPRVGLLVASLLFGLAHYVPRRPLVAWAPATLLAGLALGGLFAWTGNLVAPALAHAVVNALNLHWLGRRGAGSGSAVGTTGDGVDLDPHAEG